MILRSSIPTRSQHMAESRLDSSDLSQDNDCSLTFGSDSRTPKNVLKFGAKK